MNKLINYSKYHTFTLLGLCIIFIFIIGIIEDLEIAKAFYRVVMTLILIFSYLSIAEKAKIKLIYPIATIILYWFAQHLNMFILFKIGSVVIFFFFIFIIFRLMKKVVKSKEVGLIEFTESINAYLLFGIAGSIIFSDIFRENPHAFSMQIDPPNFLATFIYYTFVTMSTLGYGDIVPVTNFTRSLSIFFSVSGQLYMGMIVAVLVGKYFSKRI